jgi:hypothetical protein
MKFKHIVGYHNLWNTLGEIIPSLDLNTSMNMQSHHFALQDGEAVFTHSYYNMLEVMNERFGTKFIPEMSSFIGATHFTLAFAEDGDVVAEPEVVQPEVVQNADVQEEAPLISLDVEDEEVTEEESTEKQPDWDWINSLGDDSDSKKELDAYAEEEFSIKLSRRKTMENMLIDFKAALEAK